MVKLDRKAWKDMYFKKLENFLTTFDKAIIISVDNIGSRQMQLTRDMLRGKAEILMGKNTMIRKCLRDMIPDHPHLEDLLPSIVGNIGFVFTNEDLSDTIEELTRNKAQAPAKAGIIAPLDVYLEAGPTGQGPEKTSFFQALNLQTKIARGTIELLNRTQVIKVGEKVGLSEARLLNMLDISPFFYGIEILMIMEGTSIYPKEVLEITNETLMGHVMAGLAKIAAVSLQIGYPTTASVPHSIINGFKNVIAVALSAELDFPKEHAGLANAKLYLSDPEAFAAANAANAPAGGGGAAAAEEKKPEAAPVEESEEEDMEMSLFD
jgi:large subunit ribosomal protein LP0